jgi:hypothetical protein
MTNKMQTNDPNGHCYFFNNCLAINNELSYSSPEMIYYLQQKFGYIPPRDSDKTIIINDKEIFSLRSYSNLFILQSVTGEYADPPYIYLRTIVQILSDMIKCFTPLHILKQMGYKLLFYAPDSHVPLEFIKEDLYKTDFLTGQPFSRRDYLRLFIRYNLEIFPDLSLQEVILKNNSQSRNYVPLFSFLK